MISHPIRSNRQAVVGAGVILMLLAARAATAADWPGWLGPTRNGVSTEAVEPWTDAPQILWKQPVGNGFSTPVAAAGVVYVHAAVADQQAEQVTAFDLETGELLWKHSYERAPYSSALGVGPRATPSVVGDRLVTFGITGELACFDTRTGEPVWRINPYRNNDVATPGFGACSSPLVVGEHVVLPVGGEGMAIAAYELATGKLAWKALDEPASSASPIVWHSRAEEPEAFDVVVQTTLRTVGVDPQDGTVRWEHPLVFQPSGVSPTPLVSGNRLICTTQDTGTLALQAPEQAGGESRLSWWNEDYRTYFSTGTVGADGRLLLITNVLMPLPRADVRCLDPQTGQQLWHQENLGYFHVGLIATGNDRLLILDDAGTLLLAEADRDGYRELCRAKVCGGTFVNPVLVDGRLVVRDGKELTCLLLGTKP